MSAAVCGKQCCFTPLIYKKKVTNNIEDKTYSEIKT